MREGSLTSFSPFHLAFVGIRGDETWISGSGPGGVHAGLKGKTLLDLPVNLLSALFLTLEWEAPTSARWRKRQVIAA